MPSPSIIQKRLLQKREELAHARRVYLLGVAAERGLGADVARAALLEAEEMTRLADELLVEERRTAQSATK